MFNYRFLFLDFWITIDSKAKLPLDPLLSASETV